MNRMERDLAEFLAKHQHAVQEQISWWDGRLPLRLTLYLTAEQPPESYVTSVKSVVFSGDSVLVLRNPGGLHIYPGGRRERSETIEQALRREVLEETSLTLDIVAPIGFVHYQHINPRPEGYTFPYPDFLNSIYLSRTLTLLPRIVVQDEYEIEARFIPLTKALSLDLPEHQRLLLGAAANALSDE